jgi:hypothetical protein
MGNDIITGSNIDEADGILDNAGVGLLNGGEFDGFMYTGDGNDTITGIATATNNSIGLINSDTYTIDTGNGNDIITGTGNYSGIDNKGTINTGNGEDSIISQGKLTNYGNVFLGEGNDSLTADIDFPTVPLRTSALLELVRVTTQLLALASFTTRVLLRLVMVMTLSLLTEALMTLLVPHIGIHNNGGAINMGDGNDSIIANEGFESAEIAVEPGF